MGRKKYFTARDIDPLIPQLEKILGHIDLCRRRAEALAAEGEERRPAQTPAEIARNQRIRSQVQFLLEAVQDDINHVLSLGGVMKDLEAGLVDFPGQIGGEDVWLCWRRGEAKVRFWHSLDQGFDARQALPGQDQPTIFH